MIGLCQEINDVQLLQEIYRKTDGEDEGRGKMDERDGGRRRE